MTGPCRLRVRYVKDGRLAYLGHLEVMNTIMRSIRRSGLPFEVGNGFAHRMRIQFSQALPVGASSRGEYFDLMLPEPPNVREALHMLRIASPSALAPQAAVVLPRKVPSLEAWANMSRWDMVLERSSIDAVGFACAVDELVADVVLEFMRGDKPRTVRLDTTLVSYDACDCAEGVRVALVTRASERGSLRPAVLASAVGCTPVRVCRMDLWHEGVYGERIDPMAYEGEVPTPQNTEHTMMGASGPERC